MYSTLKVFNDNVLYKFTFDIDRVSPATYDYTLSLAV